MGRKRVKELRFTDGTRVETDLVVMAVGIKPNVMLAQSAGIEVNRGIIVNDYMETSIPGIYAVGECAEHRGIAYGLVAPLYEQEPCSPSIWQVWRQVVMAGPYYLPN